VCEHAERSWSTSAREAQRAPASPVASVETVSAEDCSTTGRPSSPIVGTGLPSRCWHWVKRSIALSLLCSSAAIAASASATCRSRTSCTSAFIATSLLDRSSASASASRFSSALSSAAPSALTSAVSSSALWSAELKR
jgi:hypothetical protein